MEFSELRRGILNKLADGEFHSGTELSEALKVSRTAVWKQLNALQEFGIEFTAVTGKGYRLDRPIELLQQKVIKDALTEDARSLISAIFIHDQIHSTNAYLIEQSDHVTTSGMVCLAEYQTAGKGRRGRQWVSPFGNNVYLSVLWKYQSGPATISGISLAAGVAIIRVLKKFDVSGIGLKWPNDIYWNGRKLGGILVEVSGETEGPCTVVLGIGLNVFIPDKDAENIDQEWVDLTRITREKPPSRNILAASVLNELMTVLAKFDSDGINAYLNEWRSYDCLRGNCATVHIGSRQFSGVVEGINDNGMLLIRHDDGKIVPYASGEVSFNPVDIS